MGAAPASIISSEKTRKEMEAQNKSNQERQLKLESEAKEKLEQDKRNAITSKLEQEKKQRQSTSLASAQGRRGTILTGPLGMAPLGSYTGKTLLGT
jgi:hypothetical protein